MPPSVSAREINSKPGTVKLQPNNGNNNSVMLIEDRSKMQGFASGHHERQKAVVSELQIKSSLDMKRGSIMVTSNDSLINISNSHLQGGVPTPPYRIRHVRKRSGTNRSNETSGANSLRQTPNLSNCDTVKKTTFLNDSQVNKSSEVNKDVIQSNQSSTVPQHQQGVIQSKLHLRSKSGNN